jgi:predicted dinucleotide-binding enzyme
MHIGIIGAGNMGATLAAQLTRLGHQVAVASSRGPLALSGVAARTGATPVPVAEVTRRADVVIVAIPEKSIPVAGDNPAAKSVVLQLADQLGFDGLDAGPLAESWRQQPGTPVYTTDLPLDSARQALADATPQQTASWRG